GKRKTELEQHVLNSINDAVEKRYARKPTLDPDRAYMEGLLALRAKKLTQQKTLKNLRKEARANNIRRYTRKTKEQIEHELVQKKRDILLEKYDNTLKAIIENEANEGLLEKSLKNAYRSYRIEYPFNKDEPKTKKSLIRSKILKKRITDIDLYIRDMKRRSLNLIEKELPILRSAKVMITFHIRWVNGTVSISDMNVDRDIADLVFNSKMTEFYQGSDIDALLSNMFEYIIEETEHPALPTSGFEVYSMMYSEISFHKLREITGSSLIDLPAWIKNKKACLNAQNYDDNECFKWSIITLQHHEEIGNNYYRISKLKPYINRYDWSGLKFPVSIDQIKIFEKNNPDVGVNVLYINKQKSKECKGEITILRRSNYNSTHCKIANLLLIREDDNSHYVAIKNLSALLSSLNNDHKRALNYCMNCLQAFNSEKTRDEHYDRCIDHDAVRIKMPSEYNK
ncbi:MAG: hypothetical protein J4F36_14440, partial [Nitrosopumilaceae archaeon]|nr:hypothetical protein [Nitrosopumilaceae archaeon]